MKLLPYDKFEVTVKLPPWDVYKRLVDNVSDRKLFSSMFAEPKAFKGNVEETSFIIYRNIWYRNSGLPVLHGKLETLGDVTRVDVTMKLHGLVQLLLLFFCMMELKSLFDKSHFDSFDFIFILTIAAIIIGGFWFEARLSKSAFLELFKNEIIRNETTTQDA